MNGQVGTPGRSAELQAKQNRLTAERLLRKADRWDSGAQGERTVAALLVGLPPHCCVLHDLSIPGSNGNIDHVVVTPTGMFAIDAKKYHARLPPVTAHCGEAGIQSARNAIASSGRLQ